MMPRYSVNLVSAGQIRPQIGASRVQQTVAGAPSGSRLGCNQRLVHEARDPLSNLARLRIVVSGDRLGGLQGERAGKYDETTQDSPLGIGQQVVAPAEHGVQGMMA